MKKRLCIYALFAFIYILCIFPHKAAAAETEYNFNKNKSVTITDQKCHAATGEYTWLKYTAKADGYLTVKLAKADGSVSDAKGYVSLFDSRKSALSSKSIFYNTENSRSAFWYEVTFGLKKGQKYYIRIMGENGVKVSRTFTKLKDKAGATRVKAKKLNKNKSRKGLIEAGAANADWYKIKLTKNQKIRLYYDVRSRGGFKISLYYGKQRISSRNIRYTFNQGKITYYLANKKKVLIPGTYYIKVEQADTSSSGFYKLKWN